MSRLKVPFGTTAELTANVVQEREIAADTTLDRLVYGDGVDASGKPLAFLDEVEAKQTSAAWLPVTQAATLALGLSAAGLGTEDTPTFTGLVLTGAAAGTAALDINPTANSTAMGLDIDQSGPTTGSHGTDFYYNDILINGDQANATTSVYGFAVRLGFGGSNAQGQRAAIRGLSVLNTATSASNALKVYSAITSEFVGNANDGGTDTSTGANGSAIGLYASSILGATATNWLRNDGFEVNTAIRTGGSARWHHAILVTQWADHAVSASEIDSAIHIVNQDGAVGWATDGIRFDSSQDGSGTLFKSTAYLIRTAGAESLTGGIDISSFTFSGNAWASPGATISGTGALALSRAGLPATLTNTTDAASNQALIIQSDRATPAANDTVYMSMRLSDSAGNQDEFVRILALASSVTSGAEDAQLRISIRAAGSLVEKILVSNTLFVPASNAGLALGATTLGFNGLHLSTGTAINWANGEMTITETSANLLTVAGGDLRVATACRFDMVDSQSTVGAAGGASALPATPTGYALVKINGTERVMPFYAAS